MSKLIAVSTFLLTLVIASMAQSDPRDPLVREYDVSDNLAISLGDNVSISTVTPRSRVSCIEFGEQSEPFPDGQQIAFFSEEIETIDDLSNFLDISVSARVNGILGGGGGGASLNYSKSVEISQYDYVFAVKLLVINSAKSINNVSLKENYLELLRSGDSAARSTFRRVCGDGFVGSMVSGGSLYAIVRISTNSREERESIRAKIDVNALSYEVNASFSNVLQEISKTNETRMSILRVGPKAQPISVNVDQLKNEISSFPEKVSNEGSSAIRAFVYSYVTIIADPTIDIEDFLDIDKELALISSMYSDLQASIRKYQYIVDNQDQFFIAGTDLLKIIKYLKSLDAVDEEIKAVARACANDFESNDCNANSIKIPAPTINPARR